jgi:Protein of unknown function (DUF3096)
VPDYKHTRPSPLRPARRLRQARPGVAAAATRGRAALQHGDGHVNIHLGLAPLISLLAGILILVMPRLLNYIVAVYLIVIGLIGLFGAGQMRLG